MKNKYRKLAVIMLTAVCFAGCQQEDIVYPEPDAKVAETYLTLNELTQSPLQVPGPEIGKCYHQTKILVHVQLH